MEIVSLQSCENYDFNLVYNTIMQNVKDLGGLEKYINKGETVLLKVNMLMKRKPEEATTTHPTYVKALCKVLVDYGVNVVIGDSPGGPFNKNILSSMYKYVGYENVASEIGCTLNYNCESFTKKYPNGFLLKNIVMTDMLNDVDKVISCSKLKTHGMMTFTGAVKNMFGTVPGIKKAEYHFNMTSHDDFADCLVDICGAASPILSFMDGIVGMEGEGPSGGSPVDIGVSIASSSTYHLDIVACNIINLDFDRVPTIRRCVERKICTNDLSDINIIGEDLTSFIVEKYDIPETKLIGFTTSLPKPIEKFINRHIQPKPIFNYSTCVACGICKDSCPAKVISMDTGKPKVELEQCIRCFCCQELCPIKAVTVKRPLMLKLLVKE